MSKGGGKQTTTQVQSVDPEFKERALDVYSRAQAAAEQGYTPYPPHCGWADPDTGSGGI